MKTSRQDIAITALLSSIVLLVAATQGCGNTRPCRKGTIFLTVNVGSIDADHVVVQVAVDGVSGSPTSLPLKGAKSGGVEVTFPSGYVENKSVSVTAWLEKNGAQVGTPQTTLTRLAPGCSALEVDFDRGDAGRPDTAASGGRGTGGGAVAGAGGNSGGAGGSGGGQGTGGAGTGGAATGGANTGGAATGGAATGGRAAAGAGGAATGGRGGAAGGAGGAGGRACTPTAMAENCYNNVDDDCNGLIDCADTAGCSPTSQCQTFDTAMGMVGASVAASAACPTGATTQRTLNATLTGAPCTGCSCATGSAALTCSAMIYAYGAADTSAMCAANTGGTLVATLTSAQACTTPNWATSTGFVYGIRASVFAGTPSGMCSASGTPAKGSATWGSTTKFCGVPAVGGGCGTGQVCVPRPVVAAGACLLMDGARACPTGLRQSSWFTGFTDTRTCGACTCGAPTGGDCGSMLIGAGNDYSCPPSSVLGNIRSGDHLCFNNSAYSPGLQFSGTPVAPTCSPASAVSGTLSASGPQTLCCI